MQRGCEAYAHALPDTALLQEHFPESQIVSLEGLQEVHENERTRDSSGPANANKALDMFLMASVCVKYSSYLGFKISPLPLCTCFLAYVLPLKPLQRPSGFFLRFRVRTLRTPACRWMRDRASQSHYLLQKGFYLNRGRYHRHNVAFKPVEGATKSRHLMRVEMLGAQQAMIANP